MSSYSNLDRESFQNLLASVFAVQQSRIDRQSLSAIVEVQRLITRGELDVDGAMRLIVDSARDVANATGVAIGLLNGDQLVYRAGSGCAATYTGRHLTASLTVSADNKASREILRVENTQTDTRTEAAICRQFGAKSLLILPIYHDCAVAGVLKVLFSEAHAFQNREVRTYRLMIELIEEAMSHAAQLEQKKTLTTEPTIPRAIEQITPQREKLPNDRASKPGPGPKHAIYQPCWAAVAEVGELPVLRQSAVLATIMQRAKDIIWHKRRWSVALAAVATMLVLTCWLVLSHRRPASPLGPSVLQRSAAIEQRLPFPAVKVARAKGTSMVQTALVPATEARTARTTLQRVRVGDSQVVHLGDDVTVRIFAPKPTLQPVRVGVSLVVHLGDDVTVRYFTAEPAVMPPTRPVGSATQPQDHSWPVPEKAASLKPAK